MKKCLLLIALLTLSQLNFLYGQSLFNAPDKVCVNQPVTLTSNVTNRSNYYWNFCSGSLLLTPTSVSPTGTNLGDNFGFNIPGNIDIVEDDGLFYGFVVNAATRQFIRLNFGNSLANTPTATNFGDMTQGIPINPMTLYIVHDPISFKWHIFVAGGYTPGTSQLARVDFGTHLNNPTPNVANFGNYANLMDGPRGLFIDKDADGQWFGYLVNHNTSELVRLSFSFNIQNTPLASNLGNVSGTLNFPTDMAGIKDNGQWYLFATNFGSNSISRIDLGVGLNPATPTSTIITDAATNTPHFNFRILRPSAISINRDCGMIHAYVTDSTTSQLVSIEMPAAVGSYQAIDYNNIGFMNMPSGISSILRYNDNLYGFITNTADSTLTRFVFEQCTNSSIPSYSEINPPTYSYNLPGFYNIYFVVDQGLPTQQVECKTIEVVAPPPIYMPNDTTICQGDTLHIYAVSSAADSIRWHAGYNIDTTFMVIDSVKVFPDYSTSYEVSFFYPFGCKVDSSYRVNVRKVNADAGPDRWIKDGATTVLGGPYTSHGQYIYHWTPYQFLSDSASANPYANPPYDFTYYLTVAEVGADGIVCYSIDTVTVSVDCGNFYLANAFAPAGNSVATNRFGILNKEVVKLAYLRIYNRWGALVFETTDPTKGWDGNYNGEPAPVGVYVWEAEGFCSSGKKVKKTGNVSLLR